MIEGAILVPCSGWYRPLGVEGECLVDLPTYPYLSSLSKFSRPDIFALQVLGLTLPGQGMATTMPCTEVIVSVHSGEVFGSNGLEMIEMCPTLSLGARQLVIVGALVETTTLGRVLRSKPSSRCGTTVRGSRTQPG